MGFWASGPWNSGRAPCVGAESTRSYSKWASEELKQAILLLEQSIVVFSGCIWDPLDPLGPPGTPRDPLGPQGSPWDPRYPPGTSWGPLAPPGTPRDPLGPPGDPWGSQGSPGTPRDSLGPQGSPGNPGTPWDPRDPTWYIILAIWHII